MKDEGKIFFLVFKIENRFIHAIYSEYGFSLFHSSQLIPASLFTQIHTLSLSH